MRKSVKLIELDVKSPFRLIFLISKIIADMLEQITHPHLVVNRHRTLVVALLLCAVWCVSVWFYQDRLFQHRITKMIELETTRSEQQSQAVAADLQRSIRWLQGVPVSLAFSQEILEILQTAAAVQKRIKNETAAERLLRLRTENHQPAVMRLNHLFQNAKDNLLFDFAFVLNNAGDCIAASNYDLPDSFVGNNYRERDYFKMALTGQLGYQFAFGKASRTPGLFFSAPVIHEAKIIGVVVVKVDLSRLAQDINLNKVFLIDENGVIILAQDKQQELKALENGAVHTFSTEKRRSIYRREDFPVFEIQDWKKDPYAHLYQIGNVEIPYVLGRVKLAEKPLEVLTVLPLPAVSNQHGEFLLSFTLLATSGCGLILLCAFGVLYLRENSFTRHLLQTQRDQLNEAQRLASVGSWQLNLLTQKMECSDQARWFLSIENSTLEPSLEAVFSAAHRDDRVTLERELMYAIQSGHNYHQRYRIVRVGGEQRYVLGDGRILKNAQGVPVSFSGSIRDVTEYQDLLSALELNEAHLKRVINACLIGIVQGNEAGQLIEVNAAFCKLTGYTQKYFENHEVNWQTITPEPYHQIDAEVFSALNNDISATPYEKELICADGRVISVLIGIARIEKSKRDWVCFVLDLSERNRVSRMQSEFISIVSHELRTPLTSIRGALSLLEASVMGNLPEELRQLVAIAHKNSNVFQQWFMIFLIWKS